MATQQQIELAQRILELAETPAEISSGEWEAARSAIVAQAVELARLVAGQTMPRTP